MTGKCENRKTVISKSPFFSRNSNTTVHHFNLRFYSKENKKMKVNNNDFKKLKKKFIKRKQKKKRMKMSFSMKWKTTPGKWLSTEKSVLKWWFALREWAPHPTSGTQALRTLTRKLAQSWKSSGTLHGTSTMKIKLFKLRRKKEEKKKNKAVYVRCVRYQFYVFTPKQINGVFNF